MRYTFVVATGIAVVAAVLVLRPAGSAEARREAPSGPLVVLDPGHGGTNTGAPGLDSVYEKTVTLQLARQIKQRLEAKGVRVRLTRDRDTYLTLRQRVAFANQVRADLMVSIHFNASPAHSQRGFETYILTPEALDVDARALRAGDGPTRYGLDNTTSRLVDDVERGLAMPRAARLASTIQAALGRVRGSSPNRGVRQDSMHVLLGANMPAVLVEVGFIDHPVEGRQLLQAETQATIADALGDAIAAAAGDLVGSPDATPRW